VIVVLHGGTSRWGWQGPLADAERAEADFPATQEADWQPRRRGMEHHVRPAGSPPVNGYSHAVVSAGPIVAVSGQVPLDARGELVGADKPEDQFRQTFQNLRTALEAAGSGMEHLIKLTVFLTDLADLAAFRRVRDEYLDLERPPACSLVRVAGLIHPRMRVEIEAFAAVPQ
jgi:enamine deaminase RidA (YjgF/YER057c/UK114 family)